MSLPKTGAYLQHLSSFAWDAVPHCNRPRCDVLGGDDEEMRALEAEYEEAAVADIQAAAGLVERATRERAKVS